MYLYYICIVILLGSYYLHDLFTFKLKKMAYDYEIYWGDRLNTHGFVNTSKTIITDIEYDFISKILKPNSDVIDVGCGDGKLLPLFERYKCIGVLFDIADFMQGTPIPKQFEYIVSNSIFNITAKFSVCTCISVLHHVKPSDIRAYLLHLTSIANDVVITSYENIRKRNIPLDIHCFNHDYMAICKELNIQVKEYTNKDNFTTLWI